MKIPAWATAQMVTLTVVGVLAFLLVGQCDRVRTLTVDAKKAAEAAKLDAAGIQRAHEASEAELRRRGDYALDALSKALAEAGVKSIPIVTVTGSTGPVQAGAADTSGAPEGGGGLTPPSSSAAPPPRVCLLYAGEQGEVRLSGAAVRTGAGNVAVEGSAEAWRLGPEAKLFGGPLHLEANYLSPQVPDRLVSGWGIGAAVVVSRHGYGLGPALAAPTYTLWRLQLDASAAVVTGRDGLGATATVVGRWRQ